MFTYDPKKAKELWAKADAISPWTGMFKLAYNADGGHQGWVDAVSNSIKNALGIDAEGAPVPTFGAFRDEITNRTIGSSFRSGWQADYPGLYNFLGPVFGTGGGSNDGEYSNPAFDALLQKGLAEPDQKAADADFAKAQQILFADLPQISLWYQNVTAVWSGNVSDVTMSWNSFPVFTDIVKN
ncbi:ABC transporter solute-binding protein [Leifsonia xyli subsp. cynodontis DSM 46306]|uniref:Solute-binding protein family 5 domain-containing protein n=1 Tax=Leifsonia xyli subsp. cynodontis DSM 46306 TaxID=1389489 RepID=U3P7W7_LEIXC|nr:ABC transporter substrate-binding protein [Leifsonia xyli]AGW41906.1 ABC transporter solute-binding protein [Leifsonia xyli subsp. cynodontis DSM 46306]